jgi:hypothetical protein
MNLLNTIPADLYINIILPYLDIKSASRLKRVSGILRAIVAEYQSTYKDLITITRCKYARSLLAQFPEATFKLLNPTVTIKDNKAITSIEFAGKRLNTCMKSLKHATSVNTLIINFATIVSTTHKIMTVLDQNSIFNMTQLTTLDISMDNVPKRFILSTNLSALTNLTTLKLFKCEQVYGITNLVNLTNLSLTECDIKNGNNLIGLTKLQYLHLSYVDIHIADFINFPNIVDLYMRDIQYFIYRLDRLTKLEQLSISNGDVVSLGNVDFTHLVNLTSLSITNELHDVYDLSPLVNLTELYLYNCPHITPPIHQLKYYVNRNTINT